MHPGVSDTRLRDRDKAAQELAKAAEKCRDLDVPLDQTFVFFLMGLRGLSLPAKADRDDARLMADIETEIRPLREWDRR